MTASRASTSRATLAAPAAAFFALAQAEILSDLQLPRWTKQVAGADQVRAQLGQFSFLIFGKAPKKFLADNETQHGVAQKFHLLVIGGRSGSPPGRILRFLSRERRKRG